MSSSSSNVVFDDSFLITAIDKDGKKFDRVSRLQGHSRNHDMDMTLDYNIELFPLKTGDTVTVALASSLSRNPISADGTNEDDRKWRPDGKGPKGLEEDYQYVMYGKVYKFDESTSDIVTAYASFGGLLMSLSGSARHMTNIVLGDPIYLLARAN
ncbi:RNA polymerase I [Cylindrobasidium torrendii FP15055 ss-10]|uniref:DNA-directed RNA polymerases I, II, and III subunit RPABC3 n=1 Tax=Cylindrobasidium torrendii FP15055 ss-10 TaxID=1314674 RepID=A0A0D7BQP8_9AGAR|nr:RNA polymerase I [Cylindrobasidium torrendii FP15055 ss-10]